MATSPLHSLNRSESENYEQQKRCRTCTYYWFSLPMHPMKTGTSNTEPTLIKIWILMGFICTMQIEIPTQYKICYAGVQNTAGE